jgi:hypothetical protein
MGKTRPITRHSRLRGRVTKVVVEYELVVSLSTFRTQPALATASRGREAGGVGPFEVIKSQPSDTAERLVINGPWTIEVRHPVLYWISLILTFPARSVPCQLSSKLAASH